MMIRSIIDTRSTNKEGLYPIKISIADTDKTVYFSPKIYATADNFDKDTGLLKLSSKINKKENANLNHLINGYLNLAKSIVRDYQVKGEYLSASGLKALMNPDKKVAADTVEEVAPMTFTEYYRVFNNTKKGNTRELYDSTMNKIMIFSKNKELEFTDITYQWLNAFDTFLADTSFYSEKNKITTHGLRVNSRSIMLRNIRAVLNSAIDNPLVEIGVEVTNYPFRKFKIKQEDTVKRAIKVDHLQKLFAYHGTEAENWTIDVSKIVFFSIGINIKDLYYLKDITDDEFSYIRAKTSRLYNIPVESELKDLFDKYKGDNGLIFKSDHSLKWFGMKMNRNLKTICKKIDIPEITSYSLRHTWATMASSLDIPRETIAMALGHGKKTVTDIYINFDTTKIKTANRKVIDCVLKKGKNKEG